MDTLILFGRKNEAQTCYICCFLSLLSIARSHSDMYCTTNSSENKYSSIWCSHCDNFLLMSISLLLITSQRGKKVVTRPHSCHKSPHHACSFGFGRDNELVMIINSPTMVCLVRVFVFVWVDPILCVRLVVFSTISTFLWLLEQQRSFTMPVSPYHKPVMVDGVDGFGWW